jgi:hypothetical protein
MASSIPFYDFKSLIDAADEELGGEAFWDAACTNLSIDLPPSPPPYDSLFGEHEPPPTPTPTQTSTVGSGTVTGEWVVISNHGQKGTGNQTQTQAVNVELKENGDVEIEVAEGDDAGVDVEGSLADDYLEQLAPDDAYLSCESLPMFLSLSGIG